MIGKNLSGQVFAYPGATWVFINTQVYAVCFENWEKWEYVGDTIIVGVNAKNILVTRKWVFGFPPFTPPPYDVITSYYNRYFKISGDTVTIFNDTDTSWQELYNFSLQIGDTTHSPLLNSFAFGFNCDSDLYQFPAVVTNTGLDTIDGQSLRFYTVKYRVGNFNDDFTDTIYAFETYHERLITIKYWCPYDVYFCGQINECTSINLVCYKDNAMITDSTCVNSNWWVETIGIDENQIEKNTPIYPNPTQDFLFIETPENQVAAYHIFSLDGKVVGTYQTNGSINISQIPNGIYFITNENRTWYKKFIKN